MSLGTLSAAPGPQPRRAPRPRCLPHPAGLWALRYARYCIYHGQICSCRAKTEVRGWVRSGATPGRLEGPGSLLARRPMGLWRQDLDGQVGRLCEDFLGIRRSEGRVHTLVPAVLVKPAGGSVLAIPEPRGLNILSDLQGALSHTVFMWGT